MTTRSRKLRGAGSIVFAPPAAENHPLRVTQFRAWRVKEPVSNRRYTVVRLQWQGGIVSYGEGASDNSIPVAIRCGSIPTMATISGHSPSRVQTASNSDTFLS
jgi:hypothetical protein